ncbi:MAG: hypothetical protein DSY37_00770 [Hyperthermus sp.]|nr:MAG: hypothetical protein DSY37_00770 [Hyperthermus sp.]
MSLNLKVLYEDEELVVMKAPTDEELVELVYKYIRGKGRPVTWRELRQVFSGTAGEDRLRKALIRLRREGLVVELRGGRYATIDMPGVAEELRERKRRRTLREAASLEWRLHRGGRKGFQVN